FHSPAATPDLYTLSLHDALPISTVWPDRPGCNGSGTRNWKRRPFALPPDAATATGVAPASSLGSGWACSCCADAAGRVPKQVSVVHLLLAPRVVDLFLGEAGGQFVVVILGGLALKRQIIGAFQVPGQVTQLESVA